MTKELEKALRHIKTRADLWAVQEVEKALSQEPCDAIHGSTYGGVSWGGTYKPQEPCDDAISREMALNSLIDNTHLDGYDLAEALDAIENKEKLPPVTQKPETVTEFADRCRECGAKYGKLLEQKPGKWIATENGLECSECGCISRSRADFCQYCGAKMESEERVTYGYCAYHEIECDYKGNCIDCPHNTKEDTEWFKQDEERAENEEQTE